MVPCVLDELLVRTRGSRLLPRTNDEPFPGFSSDKSLSSFEGGDYGFDVEVGGQIIGVDDGRIKWVRALQFDLSACQKGMRGQIVRAKKRR